MNMISGLIDYKINNGSETAGLLKRVVRFSFKNVVLQVPKHKHCNWDYVGA